MKKWACCVWLSLSALVSAETVGYWRFAEDGVTAGQALAEALNFGGGEGLSASRAAGEPRYSDDVPAAEIFDPVSGMVQQNQWSFDAGAAGSLLSTENAAELDGSFTLEFFIKLVGEPGSYETFLRRQEANDLAWKIDFDHAANLGFGKLRSRWDTPTGIPDGVAEAGVDENFNFVVRPQGNLDTDLIYLDTGAKDSQGLNVGPQNTGRSVDYIYDPASGIPSEADLALQGDGVNDVPEWHHVALSFDESTQRVSFYLNYRLVDSRTLSDSEGDGYTHPAAGLDFGKINSSTGGLFLDEIRYSSGLLSPEKFLRDASLGLDSVVGDWRFEESEAAAGRSLITALDSSGGTNDAAVGNGEPLYSSDIPAPVIVDPVTRSSRPNRFSFDASGPNARLRVPSSEDLNTSFTLEFFVKMLGEPSGYHSFFRRQEGSDLRWQVDFDHAALGAYGRLRSRFDTPGENNNFVVGPTGGGAIPETQRIWIDTDAGDGLVSSYDDPSDWSLDGDGVNDQADWHHVALTFDEETGATSFYYDYQLVQTRVLSDSLGDGYTHPDSFLEFGKLAASDYGMLYDEVRFTGGVLPPFLFLQAGGVVSGPFAINSIEVDAVTGQATLVWSSDAGQSYRVERSLDLVAWDEVGTRTADGASTSFQDVTVPLGASAVFYRVTRQ